MIPEANENPHAILYLCRSTGEEGEEEVEEEGRKHMDGWLGSIMAVDVISLLVFFIDIKSIFSIPFHPSFLLSFLLVPWQDPYPGAL